MKKQLKLKIIILLALILTVFLLFFLIKSVYFVEGKSDFEESVSVVLKENNYPINIDKILEENSECVFEEELISEEIDLEYQTVYVNNDKLPSGTLYITQMGVAGKQEVITVKKYKNGVLETEEIVANNVKTAAINKVVQIGTGKGRNYYKLKENDIVYVTPMALELKNEPNLDGTKIITLTRWSRSKNFKDYR